LSTLAGLLSVALLIAFVLWVLWRRRSFESAARLERLEPTSTEPPEASTTESAEAWSTEWIELPPPASVVVTPVRWEPPLRSGQAPPGSAQPSASGEPSASSPSEGAGQDGAAAGPQRRGRIEDLLERARLEDEGAA
jgi:hypothetical protein